MQCTGRTHTTPHHTKLEERKEVLHATRNSLSKKLKTHQCIYMSQLLTLSHPETEKDGQTDRQTDRWKACKRKNGTKE